MPAEYNPMENFLRVLQHNMLPINVRRLAQINSQAINAAQSGHRVNPSSAPSSQMIPMKILSSCKSHERRRNLINAIEYNMLPISVRCARSTWSTGKTPSLSQEDSSCIEISSSEREHPSHLSQPNNLLACDEKLPRTTPINIKSEDLTSFSHEVSSSAFSQQGKQQDPTMLKNNCLIKNLFSTVCPEQASPSAVPLLKQHHERFKPFHEEQWTCRFAELRRFQKEHGHCVVPHTYSRNRQLACWVKRQRRQFKLMVEGGKSTMTAERAQVLEAIGFVWDRHDEAWKEKIEELRHYRKTHGNCLVSCSYKRNPQLAVWYVFRFPVCFFSGAVSLLNGHLSLSNSTRFVLFYSKFHP